MTIVYFLMLFFVFVTLAFIAGAFLDRNFGLKEWINLLFSFLWAMLGTLFFYNVW